MTGAPSLQFLFQDTTVKNYLARDPSANSLTYDFDSNPAALFSLEALNSATNPNLHPFLGAGGKLILWHGGNDSALSNRSTAEYYQQVVGAVGGQANSDQFVRFYVATAGDTHRRQARPGHRSDRLVAPSVRLFGLPALQRGR